MSVLSPEQQRRALELLNEYRSAPTNPDGLTIEQVEKGLDQRRVDLIESTLMPLLSSYLHGQLPLPDFKSKIDGINKQHPYWGFRGIKGQMFFNMLLNVANRSEEVDSELKAAASQPSDEANARSKINTFRNYVHALGEEFIESGGGKQGRPKVGSIPFFLSYFWQIQNWRVWPVYYTNSVNMLLDQNIWRPTEELADDYIAYKHLHE
jgi:hypothetical protein